MSLFLPLVAAIQRQVVCQSSLGRWSSSRPGDMAVSMRFSYHDLVVPWLVGVMMFFLEQEFDGWDDAGDVDRWCLAGFPGSVAEEVW